MRLDVVIAVGFIVMVAAVGWGIAVLGSQRSTGEFAPGQRVLAWVVLGLFAGTAFLGVAVGAIYLIRLDMGRDAFWEMAGRIGWIALTVILFLVAGMFFRLAQRSDNAAIERMAQAYGAKFSYQSEAERTARRQLALHSPDPVKREPDYTFTPVYSGFEENE